MIIDLEPQLLRVQCKLARRLAGVLSVNLATCRLTRGGYVRTNYTAKEIDAVGVYSPQLHRCFLIPIDEISGRRAIHLRLEPTRNNQAERIKWARAYEFEAVIGHLRRPQIETHKP